jgi:hypothetical protein
MVVLRWSVLGSQFTAAPRTAHPLGALIGGGNTRHILLASTTPHAPETRSDQTKAMEVSPSFHRPPPWQTVTIPQSLRLRAR